MYIDAFFAWALLALGVLVGWKLRPVGGYDEIRRLEKAGKTLLAEFQIHGVKGDDVYFQDGMITSTFLADAALQFNPKLAEYRLVPGIDPAAPKKRNRKSGF